MKWIELNDLLGGDCLFLFGCQPTETAYQVKRLLLEKKPNATILFASKHSQIREYQASRWVRKYDDRVFHNYLFDGYREHPVNAALKSLETALQRFAQEHKFHPSEIVLVRAKKLQNT